MEKLGISADLLTKGKNTYYNTIQYKNIPRRSNQGTWTGNKPKEDSNVKTLKQWRKKACSGNNGKRDKVDNYTNDNTFKPYSKFVLPVQHGPFVKERVFL